MSTVLSALATAITVGVYAITLLIYGYAVRWCIRRFRARSTSDDEPGEPPAEVGAQAHEPPPVRERVLLYFGGGDKERYQQLQPIRPPPRPVWWAVGLLSGLFFALLGVLTSRLELSLVLVVVSGVIGAIVVGLAGPPIARRLQ